MSTREPGYYRNLLESILNENVPAASVNWKDHIQFDGDDVYPSIKINNLEQPLSISDPSVVMIGIEIPLNPHWEGTIGIYLAEDDEELENIPGNHEVMKRISDIVGSMIGHRVTLSEDPDTFEPLDGNGIGLRFRLPMSVIESLTVAAMATKKSDAIRSLLVGAKNNPEDVNHAISMLKKHGIEWPELDVIMRSIRD